MNKIFSEEKVEKLHITPYVKFETSLANTIRETQLSAYGIAVLTILGLHCFKYSNFSSTSLYDLSQLTQLSKGSVLKALKELQEKKIIQTTKGEGRGKNLYQLTHIFNGIKETPKAKKDIEKEICCASSQESYGSHHEPQRITYSSPHEPLQARPTIRKNTITKKRLRLKKMDDVFLGDKNQSMNKDKLSLCKLYVSHLKKLNLIQIKTTDAQYLASIYRKNQEADTWENLKTKTAELAEKIEVKTNTPKQEWVELEMGQKLEKNNEEPKENPELEQLKTSVSYKQDFEKIFLELRSQNPMLKPGFFADKLVHAEMLARVAEHA